MKILLCILLVCSVGAWGIYNLGTDYGVVKKNTVYPNERKIVIEVERDTTYGNYFGSVKEQREITIYTIYYTTFTIDQYEEFLEEKSEWIKK